jgi:zinc transport system ATP-binding protein
MEQVHFDSVSFAYDREIVLQNVSLTIGQAELVCIVGPNGGGKTTLLRLILGLLKPSQGSIRVFGSRPQQAKSRVGYVPQQTLHDPRFPVSVLDVVLMGRLGRSWQGAYSRNDRHAAHSALKEVDLDALHNAPFASLSGGQRQRALIARALASGPEMLLLDEPTSNVDQPTIQKLYKVLKNLSRRMTVIFVSHDVGLVSTVVTSVLCVNRTAVIHPISELSGEMLLSLYQGEMALVRHDYRCSSAGHRHD